MKRGGIASAIHITALVFLFLVIPRYAYSQVVTTLLCDRMCWNQNEWASCTRHAESSAEAAGWLKLFQNGTIKPGKTLRVLSVNTTASNSAPCPTLPQSGSAGVNVPVATIQIYGTVTGVICGSGISSAGEDVSAAVCNFNAQQTIFFPVNAAVITPPSSDRIVTPVETMHPPPSALPPPCPTSAPC